MDKKKLEVLLAAAYDEIDSLTEKHEQLLSVADRVLKVNGLLLRLSEVQADIADDQRELFMVRDEVAALLDDNRPLVYVPDLDELD